MTERKFWTRAITLGVLAIVALAIGGAFFITQMQQAVWEESVHNVLEVTEQGSKAFEIYLDQGENMLEGRAANFSEYKSTDEKSIDGKIDIYENGDPSFMVVDITHGTKRFNSESYADLTPKQIETLSALPQHGVLEPFLSDYDGRRVIGYYERFTFADGAEGMVIKTIPLSEVAEKFSLSFYNGAGFTYVVNTNGDILVRSAGESGNRSFSNIFDVVDADPSNSEIVSILRDALKDNTYGVVRMMFNNEDYIFAYSPINNTDGWYLVSVVPDGVIMEHAEDMLMTSQIFVIALVAAVLIFGVFILVSVRHRRQLKEKETEVLYREQLFDLLANNTDDVFIMVSADGSADIEYVSPNIKRVMGVKPEEASKDLDHLQNAIHNEDAQLDLKNIRAIPLGESVSFEGSFVHPITGERRWFIETVFHNIIQDVERYIVIIADRTEDRKKEATLVEALQIAKVANESKSAFLSNMSHDIRTPMNAIVGLSTLLQRDAEDPELVRQHTQKITSSSQHLLGLINDVLDMSKIESGKTSLNIGEFNLADLVEEISIIMRPQAKAKKQSFDVAVRDIQNEYLLGDRLRINQVLINILSNAIKYTPENGHITMTVQQLGQIAQNIARIRFTIEDDGIGMSEDYQRVIFQPFTREIRTVVNQIQGTGLGMAITKSLIDLMGASINVESTLGEGTTFVLEFDLRIQEREDDPNFWEDHNIAHALVVDDEVDICTEIMSAMAGTGVAMEFALNGATAVNMTKSANEQDNDFDLILLDWKMPEMDGLETARQIRATVPAHIPIMIITSYDYEEIREEGIAAGIDAFLSKPFFLSNFKEVIRSLHIEQYALDTPEEEKPSLEGHHFLYAEDNELNSAILTELLDMEGATCVIASDGKEALEAFAAAPAGTFDAILMDVQMPVMNGYEATSAIRKLDHPEAKTIPIVALTANAFADDIREALNAGMNAHIAKPVDMDILADTLSKLWES